MSAPSTLPIYTSILYPRIDMSNSYEVTGNLKLIGGIQTFPSGFTKREIIIETNDKYPQLIKLELLKDQTDLTNGMKPQDAVTASFNLRGNEHNGKYYTNLIAWRLSKDHDQTQADQHLTQIIRDSPSAAATQPAEAAEKEEPDEIPF
jgi:single-strand DNA-binding protein